MTSGPGTIIISQVTGALVQVYEQSLDGNRHFPFGDLSEVRFLPRARVSVFLFERVWSVRMADRRVARRREFAARGVHFVGVRPKQALTGATRGLRLQQQIC